MSERNTAGVSIMRLGDTFNLPRYPTQRQLEQHAVHAHEREPDSLIVKEGRSGPVIFFSSEAREADRYGKTVSDVASTPTPSGYVLIDVAAPTTSCIEVIL